MSRRPGLLALVLFLAAAAAVAQNSVHTGARLLVPDGSLYSDDTSGPNPRWFATTVEAGRSYAVEAYNSTDGLTVNKLKVELFENDGSTDFSDTNFTSCTGARGAPALEASSLGGTDGARCMTTPTFSLASRVLKIKVSNPDQGPPANANECLSCNFRIRVRETTILSRWSVNGYNMFVAIHNPSGVTSTGGFVIYFADDATSAVDSVAIDGFTLNVLRTLQFTHAASSISPNHGSLHIVTLSGSTDLDVQTYAYSVTANNFNVFVPSRPNHGGPTAAGN